MSLRKATVGLVLMVSGALYATPRVTALEAKSGNEMLLKADQLHRHMTEQLDHAQHLQSMARVEKDYIKLGCVNRGVTTAQQLITMSTDATASLERAIQANDKAAQTAELGKLSFASDEADRSMRDVDSCVGVHQVRVAVTQVEVKRDEPAGDKPPEDKTKKPSDGKPHDAKVFGRSNDLGASSCASHIIEYLAYASPYVPN